MGVKKSLLEINKNDYVYTFSINIKGKKGKITHRKGNDDIKALIGICNYILSVFDKKERVFHQNHSNQLYFFIASKDEGFALIKAYSNREKLELKRGYTILREISYFEKEQKI